MSITESLRSKKDVILGRGASEKEIKTAERELGLTFAVEYREYLQNIGLAMCEGHEFTGIGKADRTNVVIVTKQMKDLFKDIPKDWYVLENTNMDMMVIWQDTKGNVYYNRKKEYSSFAEFVAEL